MVSEVGDRVGVTRSVGNAALTLAAMERDDDAETLFEHAIALARAAETPYFLCEYLHHLADLLVRQGRHEDALTRNEEALEIARAIERHDVESPAELLSVRARTAAGLLDIDDAVAELQRIADRSDGTRIRPPCSSSYGRSQATKLTEQSRRRSTGSCTSNRRSPPTGGVIRS